MAKAYVTGPAYIYTGTGSAAAAEFLGTAEKTPRVQIRPAWSNVFNDIAGQEIPYDLIYQGVEAYVIADLTRYNESIWAKIYDRINAAGTGLDASGDIGTAMIAESKTFPLWIAFPYSVKAAYSADMPAGYHFYASVLKGPDDLDNLNTVARRNRAIFHCVRTPVIAAGAMTLKCYDHVMTGISGVVIN